MTGKEIRGQIDALNMQIEKALKPNQFILNNQVVEYSKQIGALQDKCDHVFVEGCCVYCDKLKED